MCHQEILTDDSLQTIQVSWTCLGRSGVEMSQISGGTYQFGSEGDVHRHPVEISRDFSMMTTEVTKGLWHRIMGGTKPECLDCPKTTCHGLMRWSFQIICLNTKDWNLALSTKSSLGCIVKVIAYPRKQNGNMLPKPELNNCFQVQTHQSVSPSLNGIVLVRVGRLDRKSRTSGVV